jgi:rhodanese-related sulfurtransferase
MKTITNLLAGVIIVALAINGCTGSGSGGKDKSANQENQEGSVQPVLNEETVLLFEELDEAGDYVNSTRFPSIIKASVIHEGLPGKNLIIDMRRADQFKAGHIGGAVNKRFEELQEYFEKGIKPFGFEKIILVCDDGQISGYTTALLRLAGYGNVFSMRWGMSSWNKEYAFDEWLNGLSGQFESGLDTVTVDKPRVGEMPLLNTGFNSGKEIIEARVSTVFAQGSSGVLISAEEVFNNTESYFIINLERKDKYENGHIPGAVRYKPEGTLGFPSEMATIPFDKPVVVYCGTGHNSAFATAYLRLFGYDARTLKYGNNSFMYDRMLSEQSSLSWLPFTLADVNDFEVVK